MREIKKRKLTKREIRELERVSKLLFDGRFKQGEEK